MNFLKIWKIHFYLLWASYLFEGVHDEVQVVVRGKWEGKAVDDDDDDDDNEEEEEDDEVEAHVRPLGWW